MPRRLSKRDHLGWSNSKVAKRYSHVTAAVQNNIASQVNMLLWGSATATIT